MNFVEEQLGIIDEEYRGKDIPNLVVNPQYLNDDL